MTASLKLTTLALVAALASAGGSVSLTIWLGLIACPLCLLQRAFAVAVLGTLILGLATKARDTGLVNLLAFLPAVVGGLIAGWHTVLDVSGVQICPNGVFGLGTTAQQSLASFVLILAALFPGVVIDVRNRSVSVAAVGWTLLLGAALAYTCIATTPPPEMPAPEMRPGVCHPPVPEGS
ncbi:MAG TPA: disulfide bond formation protein B [Gemmataceae bacterium]|jgi:disulfide bond formation protein DsbB|nr:disulfide bond formation protein B [Gemmataceae bacterium]